MTEELFYRRTIIVNASVEHAFEEYTAPIGGWWPRDHSQQDNQILVEYERRVGGRWYDLCFDGQRLERGKILVWKPPHRLVVSWPLAFGKDEAEYGASELEARFFAHRPGSARVYFEHRHMERTHDIDFIKKTFFSPYGWDLMVHNYQAYLASEPWLAAKRSRNTGHELPLARGS